MYLFQHVSDLGEIPGIAEDLAHQKENTAYTFAFKAFRCYNLAESYVVLKKWAVHDRALEHVTQTLEQFREIKQETEGLDKIDKVLT